MVRVIIKSEATLFIHFLHTYAWPLYIIKLNHTVDSIQIDVKLKKYRLQGAKLRQLPSLTGNFTYKTSNILADFLLESLYI